MQEWIVGWVERSDPCRARLRLQAQAVPQACSMLHETPAAPRQRHGYRRLK